ncbi:MAG: hypothetical protein NO483_02675 [Candidatus Methanomethylicia archaeon]|nr:hypothetical protein [Candidatus Methanomethylicia archaeon]
MKKSSKLQNYNKGFVRIKSKDPVQAELLTLINILECLKNEDGLWSSKFSRISHYSDPSITAIILWFVTDAYQKAGIADKLKETYQVLEKRLYVKLDKITSQRSWRDYLEVFQISLPLLLKGSNYVDIERLRTTLNAFLKSNEKISHKMITDADPLNEPTPTIVLMTIWLSNSKGMDNIDILKKFIERATIREDVDVFSLYWITELLVLLYNDKKMNSDFKRKYLEKVFYNISGTVKGMFTTKEIQYLPFDRMVLNFFTIGNLLHLSKALDKKDEALESIHKETLNYIIRIARIEALKLEEEVVRGLLEGVFEETNENRMIIDLITLALAIGALEKSRKLIVSYVTEYDLASFQNVQKTSFAIGTLMFLLAIVSLSLTFQELSQHGISLGNILFFIPPISLSSLLIFIGVNIFYRLARQSLQRWKDLKRAIIDGIKFWRMFKIS